MMVPSGGTRMSPSFMRHRHGKTLDDADIAAGSDTQRPVGILRRPGGGVMLTNQYTNEFEEFAESFSRDVEKHGASTPSKSASNGDSIPSDRLIVLGIDISHMSRRSRFFICAGGVYGFSLIYGFLQELLSVQIMNRQLGLFLAMSQFLGYTVWSYVFRTYVESKHRRSMRLSNASPTTIKEEGFYNRRGVVTASLTPSSSYLSLSDADAALETGSHWSASEQYSNGLNPKDAAKALSSSGIPMHMYFGLSILRAIDLGMTNLSMQYMNYPAKTLMKSSRVVFTMLFGVIIARRRYPRHDYVVVILMVTGLALFLHADAHSSAVFQPIGVVMLATSLMCDGAITNMSESLMQKYNVGQDEYIFRLYSIATLAISVAAAQKGDISQGTSFMLVPGSYEEIGSGTGAGSLWTVWKKVAILLLFSTTGFLGSSCAAAITKEYGALTMSITSTARKATTLFLSFAIFKNECTWEHIVGIVIFISSLIFKSLGKGNKTKTKRQRRNASCKAKSSAPPSANFELSGSIV